MKQPSNNWLEETELVESKSVEALREKVEELRAEIRHTIDKFERKEKYAALKNAIHNLETRLNGGAE